MNDVPLISVLLITYKRVELLKSTIESFLAVTDYPRNRLELILCDDGSPSEQQAEMRKLPFDIFLFAERNEGLGANCNKGIAASSGDYIFQLQDDWLCNGPADFLQAGIEVMAANPSVHMIRHFPLPPTMPVDSFQTDSNRTVCIICPHAFASCGFYGYTDTLHLKTRVFHQVLGNYLPKVPMTKMELDFCKRVDNQDQLRVAHIDGYQVFQHIGEEHSFNPGVRREKLKQAFLKNAFTRVPFQLYLKLKHRNS